MNNQAAQTMPSWVQERELIRATLCKELDTDIESDERTYTIAVRAANALHWRKIEIDQLKAQVAALSQTAGVDLEQFRDVVNHYLSYYRGSLRLAEDSLSPITCGANDLFQRRIDKATRLLALIDAQAAAPAASGGEDIADAVDDPNGTCPTCHQYLRTDAIQQPPAGASVSERAREILAQQYEKESDWMPPNTLMADKLRNGELPFGVSPRHLAAIEQALTQQHALSSPRQEGEVVQGALFWKKMHDTAMALIGVQNAELAHYRASQDVATNRDEISRKLTSAPEMPSTAASTQSIEDAVEQKARELFEAQADELSAPWDMQWDWTKQCWRKVARESLLTSPTTGADGESLLARGGA